MKQHLILGGLILLFVFFGTVVYGQDTSKGSSPVRINSSSTIPTGDIVDSVKYYIKITPGKTIDKHMPKYKPDEAEFVPVDTQPVPIRKVQAKYPDEARRLKIEGTVWVKCLVGKDGKVMKASVARSDAGMLDTAAIDAALQWKFSPARSKGKPVAVWAAIPFRFKLNN